jgi:hypothetical protein
MTLFLILSTTPLQANGLFQFCMSVKRNYWICFIENNGLKSRCGYYEEEKQQDK